jgi:hypothetical protein
VFQVIFFIAFVPLLSFKDSSLKPWEEFKEATRSIATKKTKELKRNTTKNKQHRICCSKKKKHVCVSPPYPM